MESKYEEFRPSAWKPESSSDSETSDMAHFHPSAYGSESSSDSETSDMAHFYPRTSKPASKDPADSSSTTPTLIVSASRANTKQGSKKGSNDAILKETEASIEELVRKISKMIDLLVEMRVDEVILRKKRAKELFKQSFDKARRKISRSS